MNRVVSLLFLKVSKEAEEKRERHVVASVDRHLPSPDDFIRNWLIQHGLTRTLDLMQVHLLC